MHSTAKCLIALLASCAALTASASAQDTSKINKWFDAQKGKTYDIQKPGAIKDAPAKIQAPGAIQKPGNMQIPRGTKAIKQSDSSKCEHRYAVQYWLVDNKFIKAATVTGFGKTHPIAPNTKQDGTDNPAGRQLNRRVEVVVDRCKSSEVSH